MKLLYPNQSEATFIKTFTIKLNNRDYFFYTVEANENASKVAFGELKNGSLFAVEASELDSFRRLLTDIANNRMINNPSYKKIETNLDTITIYGGSEATLSTKVLEPIFNAEVVTDTPTEIVVEPVVEEKPAIEPTVEKEVVAAPLLEEVKEDSVKKEKKSNKLVFAIITALLLVAIGIGAYFLLNNQKKPTPKVVETPKEEVKEITFKKLVCTPTSPVQDTTNDEVNESNLKLTRLYTLSFNSENDELAMIEDVLHVKYPTLELYNSAKETSLKFKNEDPNYLGAGIMLYFAFDDPNLTVIQTTVSKKATAYDLDSWNKVNSTMLNYSQAKESLKIGFDCK